MRRGSEMEKFGLGSLNIPASEVPCKNTPDRSLSNQGDRDLSALYKADPSHFGKLVARDSIEKNWPLLITTLTKVVRSTSDK